MSKTLRETLTRTREGMLAFQQERAIIELTELICQIMDEKEVCRSGLASLLGTTKGYVTQLLDGRTNMTVRKMSDIFMALECTIHFQERPLSESSCSAPLLSLVDDSVWSRCWNWPEPVTLSCNPPLKERSAG